VIPFKLDANYLNKQSKFDILFYCEGVKYAYGFSATSKEVVAEYLYSFKNDEQHAIFERTKENGFDFSENEEKDEGVFNFLRDFNTENKLFLSTAGAYKKLTTLVNWFYELHQYTQRVSYNFLRNNFFDKNADVEKTRILSQAIQWVKEIDVGISAVQLKTDPDLFKDDYSFDNGYWDKYTKILSSISTTHEALTHDGTRSKVDFNFYSDESSGTNNFFSIALAIAEKMSRAGLFLADELNNSLHTLLSKYIVSLFHDSGSNPLFSQLIFTTHDTNLLDLDLFRRDQIWFTEKNPDTGATDVYSLCDFEDVKHDMGRAVNVEKGYLLGIYGAVPFIKGNAND
jgi:AAA15 family ATPase/GTPase